MKKFKRQRDYGFFDQDIRLSKLSELGDPLEKLKGGIDFELFRILLEDRLTKMAKGKGGRPPYDYILMFKILILQRYYNLYRFTFDNSGIKSHRNQSYIGIILNIPTGKFKMKMVLSDDQVEYQINDRMSFMRFLNLTISDAVPDSKTVWKFREQLTDLGLVGELFNLFLSELEQLGLIVHEGKIIDASFIQVPIQRNNREDNKEIKEGGIPESISSNPAKKAQKDLDARWTKKNNVNYFGYKDHAKIDVRSKIITAYMVTDASVHDSQVLDNLLDKEKDGGQAFYADSAYTGEKAEECIKSKKMDNQVCEKGYRNKPLTEDQRQNNREKSKVRARVEHVFGFMETAMNGMYVRNIGIKRIEAVVGLMNLTYNMFRKLQLQNQ